MFIKNKRRKAFVDSKIDVEMVLNYIWISFFVLGFLAALYQWIVGGNGDIFPQMVTATFDSSKTAFEISLGLTGILSLWSGLMKVCLLYTSDAADE